MELNREVDPKSEPPKATGAFIEKKKIQVITAVAVGFGLLVAMFLGWLLMRSRPPVMAQRPLPVQASNGVPPMVHTPKLSESAEEAYEKGRSEGIKLGSNPAFNLGTSNPGQTRPAQTAKAEDQTEKPVNRKAPKDAYEDLLAKAAEADSAVEGGKDERHNSVIPRVERVDDTERRPEGVSGLDGHSVGNSGDGRSTLGDRKGLAPVPPNTLPAGTFIAGALVNELQGDNVGPLKVQTASDVYNPQTFDLAIPQGSVFIGEAQKVSAQFQQRIAVSFDRLQITRDGRLYEIKLDRIPGLDQEGATALKDKVDNHYAQIFGVSLAIGALGGLAQVGNGNSGGYYGSSPENGIRNGITQSMASNASQILNRFLTRTPTVKIRPGTRVLVYIPFGVDLS